MSSSPRFTRARATFDTAAQMVSLMRRTPDPTLQLVRTSVLRRATSEDGRVSNDITQWNFEAVRARRKRPRRRPSRALPRSRPDLRTALTDVRIILDPLVGPGDLCSIKIGERRCRDRRKILIEQRFGSYEGNRQRDREICDAVSAAMRTMRVSDQRLMRPSGRICASGASSWYERTARVGCSVSTRRRT